MKVNKRNVKCALTVGLTAGLALALTGCGKTVVDGYTYVSATTALADDWNPHTWESSADDEMLSYLEEGMFGITVKNSVDQEYQRYNGLAVGIEDVTGSNQSLLTDYNVILPTGQTAANTTEGYIYDIDLREGATWENGDAINADTYIYSMQQLLDPTMKNYRANNYYSGTGAIAGAANYYYQGSSKYIAASSLNESIKDTNSKTYGSVSNSTAWSSSYTMDGVLSYFDAGTERNTYQALLDDVIAKSTVQADGFFELNSTNQSAYESLCEMYSTLWGDAVDYSTTSASFEMWTQSYADNYAFDGGVGFVKLDDYKIRWIAETQQDLDLFYGVISSGFLVHEETYEAAKTTVAGVTTSKYGTSEDNTMSYGPYKLETYEAGKQVVLVQNENWWGYEDSKDKVDSEGNPMLYSETEFEVDGKKVEQYQTTKVVMKVMTEDAMKLAFMKGEIMSWSPSSTELSSYTMSEALYQVDETYTMSLFFNSNEEALKTMDSSKGNTNSIVLSNDKFREAMSVAINRKDWVTSTAAYKPSYSLLSPLYYYDVYKDPSSIYRNTDQAMEAITNLYGVSYGAGTNYATLEEAYKSIDGFNLSQAENLMKAAHDELVAEGLYTSGQNIHIKAAWAYGSLTSDDQAQVAKIQAYLNTAAKDSGFGSITIEPVGSLNDRYGDVPAGEYAIGYGAWGGAAFYPFQNMRLYMDPSYQNVNELACWDPVNETKELTFTDPSNSNATVTKTMTYQAWSQSLIGSGEFSSAPNETKLDILAGLEQDFLSKYYRIPLAQTCASFLLSYKVSYYTENYNIMYSFGGFRLMSYNYDDTQWNSYVSQQGGELNYI